MKYIDISDLIKTANSTRSLDSLSRRIIKLSEELGELSQAYLSLTSSRNNPKKATWAGFREEAVDVAIIALDIAMTPLPDVPESKVDATLAVLFKAKVAKWLSQAKPASLDQKS